MIIVLNSFSSTWNGVRDRSVSFKFHGVMTVDFIIFFFSNKQFSAVVFKIQRKEKPHMTYRLLHKMCLLLYVFTQCCLLIYFTFSGLLQVWYKCEYDLRVGLMKLHLKNNVAQIMPTSNLAVVDIKFIVIVYWYFRSLYILNETILLLKIHYWQMHTF